jgi:hypothetical protein
MSIRSLFNGVWPRSPRTSARQTRRPPRVRPLLESLEDRRLLSTYVVNAVTDTGAGSGLAGDLRYCITNATSGSDTITFGVTGTIKLESALPALNTSVDIQGPGASQLTVERDPASTSDFGIFAVGSAATVAISGLTVADGANITSTGGGAIGNAGTLTVSNSTLTNNTNYSNNGGAIANTGTLTINNSTLTQNFTPNSGGAVYNAGTLTINNSTLSGNSSEVDGGALYNTGTVAISNDTLSGNAVSGYVGSYAAGGAIYMGGGKLSLNNSTLANNSAYGGASTYGCTSYGCGGTPAGNGLGGGLYLSGGTVTIDHSTVAGNAAASQGYPYSGNGGGGIYNAAGASALQMHDTILADNAADYGPDLSGSVTSLGYNLFGNSSGGTGFAASDLVNYDPLLGPLQNNGGPTQTMALPAYSPAVNAGDPADNTNPNTPAFDQRGPGFPRIVGGQTDIGAFEVQNLSGLLVSGFPGTIKAGVSGGFTVTARNADGSTDTGYTGTITFSSTDPTATFADAATGGSLLSGSSYTYTFVPGDNGTHQFTAVLTRAGTQSITATDATTAGFMGLEENIVVQPADASKVLVSGFSSPADAEVTGNLGVTLEDPYGNIATGYTGTVKFSTTDARATIVDPASGNSVALAGFTYTFTAADAGARSFSATLNTPGTQSITATDTANAALTGSESNIQVVPVTLVVSGFPSPTSAGLGESFTVTAEDPSGNVATGYTGTIALSSSDTAATFADGYSGGPLGNNTFTFTASDYGSYTFVATLNTAGTQSITATDTAIPSDSGAETGIVVDPAVTVSGPTAGYLSQPLSFTLGTFGDPAGTTFTYQINWGDGSPTQTVSGPSGTQVTHAFNTAGSSDLTVTATDPKGLSGTNSEYVRTVPVTVAVQTDPATATTTKQQMLVITDSGYGDSISLSSVANSNSVALTIDGYNMGTVAPTTNQPFALVMVLGGATTGYVDFNASSLTVSTVLVGGSGTSYLYGSSSARNLLIAGTGYGDLYAGSAGDILIGGYTSYDSNTTALAYIMAEWDSSASYSTRVSKLGKGGGLNGSYVLNGTTVFDNSLTDYLYGGAGLDWFFARTKGKKNLDKIYNRTSGETVTSI